MKRNEASIFVFMASIIVGILIAVNINLSRTSSNIQLTANEYSDAVGTRTKITKEINDLKHDNEEILNKINQYTGSGHKNISVLEDLKSQLNLNKMIDGLKEVKGPGLKITITDGDVSEVYDPALKWMRILHDNDMMHVVNDLRAAGAEAITINKRRVNPGSWILCDGPFLKIDDIQIPAPFEVEAIGDPKAMAEGITSEEGYAKKLTNRGVNVTIGEVSEIEMTAQKTKITPQYMEPYINEN